MFMIIVNHLVYAFGWADFLTRYAVFMALAPLALWLIAKGKAWLVAAASIAVWFFLRDVPLFLPFSAWQIVFVAGIVFGFYLPRIEAWFRSMASQQKNILYYSLVSFTAVTFIGSLVCFVLLPRFGNAMPWVLDTQLWAVGAYIRDTLVPLTNKDMLDPLRLVVGFVWFIGLYMLLRKHETRINKYTGGVLALFGKNSLYVYGFHALILFVIELYVRPAGGSGNVLLNTLMAVVVLVSIYFLTKYRLVFTRIKLWLFPSLRPSKV